MNLLDWFRADKPDAIPRDEIARRAEEMAEKTPRAVTGPEALRAFARAIRREPRA